MQIPICVAQLKELDLLATVLIEKLPPPAGLTGQSTADSDLEMLSCLQGVFAQRF